MAKFAQECLFKFNEMTRQLEPTLGPDTGEGYYCPSSFYTELFDLTKTRKTS